MNLAYAPKQYIPGGGASGSSIRTKENKIVAIFHSANAFASVGLSAALRSSGFDYQGLYGTYNLPQYDVIYGTGKDQQNSYRHEMLKRNKGRTW
ncbi:Membrane-associated lipoprotein precursor, partial [Mycoplasmopsis edwardii]